MGLGTAAQTVTLTANSISGFINGAGVQETWGAALTMVQNTVSGSKWGVKVVRGSPAIGTTSTESDNYLTNNMTGVYVDGDTTVAPVIRNCYISANTYGVQVRTHAKPDLGTGTNNRGNNYLAGNSAYCIWNRNSGNYPQVPAQYNYFGEWDCEDGDPPYCVYGNVDNSNGLCMEPEGATGSQMVETPLPPRGLRIASINPNPMLSTGVIHLSLEQGRTQVKVELFDVSGRLVRSFGEYEVGPGQHPVYWDGLNEQGVPVRSGIYFVRGRSTDGQRAGARILVAR